MWDLTYDVVSLIVKTLTFRNYCYVIVSMIHKTLWSPSFCGSLYTHNTSTAANNTSPCQALHSGIAICSPRSPTPTFWNAGIFWNHSRPSLQSQSPLQACRLSLNAPGCPAISREDPTLQEKPMHVQFRRLQVDDSRLRKKDADTKLQASFTKVNSRTRVRFATSFSTANLAGNDSLRSRSRTAHNRFLQPLRFSFLCERPQSPDRSKNAFSSANLYHIEYFTYLPTVSSSDVSTFVAFLT